MKQEYFVLVLAHSIHGRLRRVHIPHQVIYAVLCLALLGFISVFGFVSSYARMAWKVANYNALKREADVLRARFRNLQKEVNQQNQQLASLEMFASEVSLAYGIKQKLEGPVDIAGEAKLAPTFTDSVREFNYLRTVSSLRRSRMKRWEPIGQPNIWPVNGRLMGHFGQRTDPFSGEGALHTGVDISAPTGTPVHATADGTVVHAEYSGGYGRLVVIDHADGMQTYYAHLSKIGVLMGQEIRRGELVGAVGTTGRTTAPHLHYEVRVGKAPVNPYRFLSNAGPAQTVATRKDFPF